MWQIALDCYPTLGTEEHALYECAVATVWVDESVAATEVDAEREARTFVREADLIVVDVLERTAVTVASCADGQRHFVEQARRDKRVCHLQRVERRYLESNEALLAPSELIAAYAATVAHIAGAGAFALIDDAGEQAIGELDEDYFVALFPTREGAERALLDWSDCAIVPVSPSHLRHELLASHHADGLVLMLEVVPTVLAAFHPLALRDSILKAS